MPHYDTIELTPTERRLHTRTPVGIPARVHFVGRALPVAVELRDVSVGGCYFTGALAPRAARFAFAFRLPDRQVCVAAGRVLRVDPTGFAAALTRTSKPFDDFMDTLSPPVATHAA